MCRRECSVTSTHGATVVNPAAEEDNRASSDDKHDYVTVAVLAVEGENTQCVGDNILSSTPDCTPGSRTPSVLDMLKVVRDLRFQERKQAAEASLLPSHLEWANDSLDKRALSVELGAALQDLMRVREECAVLKEENDSLQTAKEQLQARAHLHFTDMPAF